MRSIPIDSVLAILLSLSALTSHAAPSVADFAKRAEFTKAVISPNGEYVALAAPADDQTGLAVLDIRDYPDVEVLSAYKLPSFEHVHDIMWASDERVLFTSSRQRGTLGEVILTGKLYAMDADGRKKKHLYGGASGNVFRYSRVIDPLPEDRDWILVSTFTHDRDYPKSARLNVYTGRLDRGIGSPLNGGSLFADSKGNIRFAFNETDSGDAELAYRSDADAEWEEISFEIEADMTIYGFAADDQSLLVNLEKPGAMGLYRLDPRSGETTEIIIDDHVEPSTHLDELGSSGVVIGARFEDGIPENRFVNESEITARVYRALERSFPGKSVNITSTTHDGIVLLVGVYSDRQPLQYYLFDLEKLAASFLLDTREWIKADDMGERRPVSYSASDGRKIPGYLTLPPDREAENLPLVLVVHGGPHQIRDTWGWDPDAQLLATRGYAVLQPNFRGSAGYGDEFERAGFGKWGTRMQEDMTDGVRWLIEEGIVDGNRVCVYGASYGGYSVLQQLVREPDLFRCGFAFAGIYDLNLMFEEGNIAERESGINYLDNVLGTDAEERSLQSPINHVGKIIAPLYLVHGEEDRQAHIEHFHRLRKTLDANEIPYASMLVDDESHGFYFLENRVKFYQELVDFIDEHIGD